ncbi:MFS transporter [Altericroceibacterium endophyticum]|uniref:MFS transporter n=1 Tax=Altericroceibacterium endophyticum TaxID=1808508 RepID=A0A6I4T342_9SPHN|nr:MFS transporter [Altericroceibacterium endophyticum]MXO64410.1 MFS transporter [Altericroceibacterium endophyticum]
MSDKQTTPIGGKGALIVLLLVVFINIAGFGIVIPLLPFYAESFGISAWQVTILFSAYSVGQFLGEPLWGRISDRIGRKPVLMGTMAAIGLSYLLLAYAPDYNTALVLRFVAGIAGGNISTTQAYVADITPPEKRTERLGLLGAAFGLGFMVGPAIGGLLVVEGIGAAGYRPPLLCAAILGVLSVLGIIFFLKESHDHSRRAARQQARLMEAMRHPIIGQVLLTTLIATGAFSAMEAIYALWTAARFDWGPHEVGLTFTFIGALSALNQAVIAGWIVRRIGEAAALTAGLLLGGISLIAQVWAPDGMWLVGITVFTVIGISITQPAISGLISLASAPEQQGALLGVNGALGAFARIIGPIIAGALFSGVSVDAPYIFAGAGMLPAAWLAWRVHHRIRQGGHHLASTEQVIPKQS